MNASSRQLRRDVGLPGATFLGLGSILGTGVFVSIGLAAGAGGPSVLLAIALAGLVAACNALSSAQLAAAMPVSGGTYEYAYRLVRPSAGFAAGWMFLCAKSASAATAALGFSGYALHLVGADDTRVRTLLGVLAVAVLTVLVLTGVRRSSVANIAIVSVTLVALGAFVVFGLASAAGNARESLAPFFRGGGPGLLEATALMFVAYTGYGRIATMGEEVRDPERTIPRAIIVTLFVSAFIYAAVGFVAVSSVGAGTLADAVAGSGAPLEAVARTFGVPGVRHVVAVGAITAMLGVLLNLILGLSRVVLAMARRNDLPASLARVNRAGTTPGPAVVGVGVVIGAITLVGSISLAWSFSAFTVLVYYALTNVSALRLPREERLYPSWVAWCGLVGCLSLAFWVEPRVWIGGLGVLGAGFVVRAVCRAVRRDREAA